jgi:protein-S-isoprenylcysteine O-methyltransferase Ste14
MVVLASRPCLTALLIACFVSFAWGMRYFFRRPAKGSSGMLVIQLCGASFALLHLGAILYYGAALGVGAGTVAAVLYLCSLWLFWWAIRSNQSLPLSAAFLNDPPRHLMDRGPYRYMRHPFYTSYLLAWSAGVVAVGRWWLAPTLVVMCVIYWKASQAEEQKFASSPLAADYAAYRGRAGRFLPNPWKVAGRGSSGVWVRNAARLD